MRYQHQALQLVLLLVVCAEPAEARRGGIAGGGCVGCHDGGEASISLVANPPAFAPGDQVSMALNVGAPQATVAGVFVDCGGVGSLETLPGQGLAEVDIGLVHTSPRSVVGGSATFNFNWTAPAAPGDMRCIVYAVAGDGNGRSSGDIAAEAVFDFLYGCDGDTYYRDLDNDGFGVTERPRTACAGSNPAGYALEAGDCNDNHAMVHPGAVEYCNERDDNCNGEVDEESLPVQQYPDADGDGYYSNEEFSSGESVSGCLLPGYAAEPGDCRADDPTIHPGAEEVCNLYDDDCDGRVDFRVRPQCGEGRCRRESGTCDLATCIPGEPLPETCNLLDDDCDGLVDNGELCENGLSCIAGQCRSAEANSTTDGATSGSSPGAGGATGASGTTGASLATHSGNAAASTASSAVGGAASTADPAAASGAATGGCSLVDARPNPAWLWLMLLVSGSVQARRRFAR